MRRRESIATKVYRWVRLRAVDYKFTSSHIQRAIRCKESGAVTGALSRLEKLGLVSVTQKHGRQKTYRREIGAVARLTVLVEKSQKRSRPRPYTVNRGRKVNSDPPEQVLPPPPPVNLDLLGAANRSKTLLQRVRELEGKYRRLLVQVEKLTREVLE